jgi:hypothetical protein
LAKLALDQRLHGEGLGSELLVHALTTIIGAARAAGGRLVVVEPLTTARPRSTRLTTSTHSRTIPADW